MDHKNTHRSRQYESLQAQNERDEAEKDLNRRDRAKGTQQTLFASAGILALGGAVVLAPAVLDRAQGVAEGQIKKNRMENTSTYNIPTENEAHRIVVAGNTYEVIRDGKRTVFKLIGIDSAAQLINASNPEVSFDEAKDYLMAQNSVHQAELKEEGALSGEIDPLALDAGQPIVLPTEFGVGQYVNPNTEHLGSGAEG